MAGPNEAETVHKKILPYLRRREYDIEKDLDFEYKVKRQERMNAGYADIAVMCGKSKPLFIIECKRSGRVLSDKDRIQALEYGRELGCPFVVVTNGVEMRAFNVMTEERIKWNGFYSEKIPTKSQALKIDQMLRQQRERNDLPVGDTSLPYRPGLPRRQLDATFFKLHSIIRDVEKDESQAFEDVSRILFLKLLEERADQDAIAVIGTDREPFTLPYSTVFWKLASDHTEHEADQVLSAIENMIGKIQGLPEYAGVLPTGLALRKPRAAYKIVAAMSKISFTDSGLDSKGSAFEYFVRATLKGKQLGQYFTPRNLIALMVAIVGREKVLAALRVDQRIKVLDPACGTAGFLVYLLEENMRMLDALLKKERSFLSKTHLKLVRQLREETFYGSDANVGVTAAARMNLIVAGGSHANIRHEDSLAANAKNWSTSTPDADLILTNPPFGTSEAQSLQREDWSQYEVGTKRGQLLFVQKMVLSATPGTGEICTVIDEGALSTRSAATLRMWLFKHCHVQAIVELPSETFKPNKINVKAAVLYLRRRERPDEDLEDNAYQVAFCRVGTLGYHGSGETIRNFDFDRLVSEIGERLLDPDTVEGRRNGHAWEAYNVAARDIVNDGTCRLDYKYWEPTVRQYIQELRMGGAPTVGELVLYGEALRRGKSPESSAYTDKATGYALVVKSGSNISSYGDLSMDDDEDDYVDQPVYEDLERAQLRDGDIMLSSTGDGTAGKCAVYRREEPALADGHVTIIRLHEMGVFHLS